MQVQFDAADVERIRSDLRHIRDGMPISVMRAINRTVDGVKTNMVTIARREYNVNAAAVRANISVKKATKQDISGYTISRGRPIPLINFSPRPSTPQPRRKAPITVEVIRDQRKPLGGGGFVAVMPSGHKGVFWRAKVGGKKVNRLPIHELDSSRVEDLYARPTIQIEIQTDADNRMKKELIHQADYLFKQRMGLL
jgi:hypothetical protein